MDDVMKIRDIDSLSVRYNGNAVGTLSLSPDNRLCVFEYDRDWLVSGFSISPFELPLKPGAFIAKPHPFYGNFGVFEDCLPDGYGRYLLHKTLMKHGIDDFSLTSLQRLSLVGDGGMGALAFAPVSLLDIEEMTDDYDMLQTKALEVLRERQDIDAAMLLYNSGNSGGARPKAVFSDSDGHWLIKFRHIYDPVDMGVQEYRYNEAAKRCGIDVPDFRLANGKYFTSRRFDITLSGRRLHVLTAGGLLCVSLSEPVLDYGNLLALTGFLTHDPMQVEEMYRRMIFNYLTDNKDDHCKNFSFMVDGEYGESNWRWCLSPAYDLTYCNEGYNGEHATSVNRTGNPKLADFIAVGKKIKMKENRCRDIIDQVIAGASDLIRYSI